METDISAQSPTGNRDFWVETNESNNVRMNYHIKLLQDRIQKILFEVDRKSTDLTLRLQKVIFKSRIRPEIRRKISGSIANILREFPWVTQNNRETLNEQILWITNAVKVKWLSDTDEGVPEKENTEILEREFPLHRKIHMAVMGEISHYEATEEELYDIGDMNEFWYVLLLDILDTQSLRMRDLRMYRLCESLISAEIVKNELVSNVLQGWALKILFDPALHEIYDDIESSIDRESLWMARQSEIKIQSAAFLDIWNSNWRNVSLDEFYSPRLSERKKTVQITNLADVKADFAWSMDALVKKYEKMKRIETVR